MSAAAALKPAKESKPPKTIALTEQRVHPDGICKCCGCRCPCLCRCCVPACCSYSYPDCK